MRISDLSTFDSKPILWSQLDELLHDKNVTMLGNQANIPSGLVVLDDKGKIPEDADIQHIFYVDNEFPTSGLVKNSLYVSSTGEAIATNDNAEYINISLQVVTDFSTVSDETVATTKAIKDYVNTAVTEVATGTSGVLSSYATKEYVDNAVASASGEQHIFYVDALPSIKDAIENSLYVVKGTKEAQIFDGTEYAPISLEALTDFSTVSNDTLATTQAISAFVDEKISNIDIPDPDLSAYQPISGMSDYALKTDIPDVPEEVIYVDEFPTSGLLDTIYVNKNGQSKIWNGTEFVSMSYEIVDSISTETSQSGVVVPSVQAVIDYVSAYTPTLPDNITTQGNEFNSGNQLVQLVDGKIPESLYNGDTQHIFYVDEFPTSGMIENSIYILESGEAKAYFTSGWIDISKEIIETIDDAANNNTIPTSKAIKDYIDTNKLTVNTYENIEKLNFTNARLSVDSVSSVINIDTSMNVDNESALNAGNPLVLNVELIGNDNETYVLLTGDDLRTAPDGKYVPYNNGLNKAELGEDTYSTAIYVKPDINYSRLSNVPPLYGQDSSGHYSISVDGQAYYSWINPISGYYKVSTWIWRNNVKNNSFIYIYYADGYNEFTPLIRLGYNKSALNDLNIYGAQISNYTYEDNTWQYIEFVVSTNKIKLCVDGEYKGEFSANIPSLTGISIYGRHETDSARTAKYAIDQFTIKKISESDYNNYENIEHLVPTQAAGSINSTSFTLNDKESISETDKIYVKSGSEAYLVNAGLINDLATINVDAFNNVKTLSFPNAKTYLDSTDDSKVIVDTTTTYNNYTADEIGNSMWLNGHFIGNNDQCKLLYTGDSYDTLSNYPLNIALGKDSTYSVQDPSKTIPRTSSYYPPIYSDSETHYSLYNGTNFSITGLDTTSCYKFSMWFMRTGFDSKGFFLLKNNNYSYGFFRIENYGKISIGSDSNRLYTYDYSKYGVWHYVELVVNNGAIKFYIGTSEDRDQGLKAKLALNTTVNASNVKINPSDILTINEYSSNFYIDQLCFQTLTEAEYSNYDEYGVTIPATASSVELFATFDTSKVDNIQNTDLIDIIRGKTRNQVEISALSSVISSMIEYPIADTETLGMVKVGENLTIDETGILNADLSNYYTKTDSDNKYALKTEINNPEQKTEVTTNAITFKKDISIYKIEISQATTFTFDFSQLDENNCYTFELWVSMSTSVTLTFPSEAAWLNDEVPDMSEISTYCIVVRKLPATMGTSTITSPKALLNLAYQYPLVLG